ncbi:MAG: hypothetical protein FJW39_30925 [Acidobacteria bacterium]|nr:hypothetical protein [Acidobacteriota bacterium]
MSPVRTGDQLRLLFPPRRPARRRARRRRAHRRRPASRSDHRQLPRPQRRRGCGRPGLQRRWLRALQHGVPRQPNVRKPARPNPGRADRRLNRGRWIQLARRGLHLEPFAG